MSAPRVALRACWRSSRPRRSTGSTAGSSGSRSTSRRACPGSPSSASRTPRSRRPASGSAARCATPASATRRAGSPSTSPRPTCARRARRSTSRSRSGILLGSEQVRRRPGRWRVHRRAVARRRGPPGARRPADGRARSARRGLPAGRRAGVRRRRGAARRADRGGGVETLVEAVERVRSAGDRGGAPARRGSSSVDAATSPTDDGSPRSGGLPAGWPRPDLTRGPRPARRAARARDRARRRARPRCSIGPPGRARRSLARTIPGLLPPLDDAAALAATVVASAAGEGPISGAPPSPAVPVAAPHDRPMPRWSAAGRTCRPGEVTHNR